MSYYRMTPKYFLIYNENIDIMWDLLQSRTSHYYEIYKKVIECLKALNHCMPTFAVEYLRQRIKLIKEYLEFEFPVRIQS
jgi:hypothetical protein